MATNETPVPPKPVPKPQVKTVPYGVRDMVPIGRGGSYSTR